MKLISTKGFNQTGEWPLPKCPYNGLRPYDYKEFPIFFGRDRHIQSVVNSLNNNNFISIVGNSGCGKSSLIRAGVAPALRLGEIHGKYDWSIIRTRPGNKNPLKRLADDIVKSISDIETDTINFETIYKEITSTKWGLIDFFKNEFIKESSTSILIIFDQFEELFSLSEKDFQKFAHQYCNTIIQLKKERPRNIYAAITMRADFIGNCARIAGLTELLNETLYILPPLHNEEIKETIRSPIRLIDSNGEDAYGKKIDEDLIDTLLDDFASLTLNKEKNENINDDKLPMIQHVLLRMWYEAKKQDITIIDEEIYRQVGKIEGSINKHGEEILQNLKQTIKRSTQNHTLEQIVQLIFRQLINKNDGSRQKYTRRELTLGQICDSLGFDHTENRYERETVLKILWEFKKFENSFIYFKLAGSSQQLKTKQSESKLPGWHPDHSVIITHESLIRRWDKLRQWANQENLKQSEINRIFKTISDGNFDSSRLNRFQNWLKNFIGKHEYIRNYFLFGGNNPGESLDTQNINVIDYSYIIAADNSITGSKSIFPSHSYLKGISNFEHIDKSIYQKIKSTFEKVYTNRILKNMFTSFAGVAALILILALLAFWAKQKEAAYQYANKIIKTHSFVDWYARVSDTNTIIEKELLRPQFMQKLATQSVEFTADKTGAQIKNVLDVDIDNIINEANSLNEIAAKDYRKLISKRHAFLDQPEPDSLTNNINFIDKKKLNSYDYKIAVSETGDILKLIAKSNRRSKSGELSLLSSEKNIGPNFTKIDFICANQYRGENCSEPAVKFYEKDKFIVSDIQGTLSFREITNIGQSLCDVNLFENLEKISNIKQSNIRYKFVAAKTVKANNKLNLLVYDSTESTDAESSRTKSYLYEFDLSEQNCQEFFRNPAQITEIAGLFVDDNTAIETTIFKPELDLLFIKYSGPIAKLFKINSQKYFEVVTTIENVNSNLFSISPNGKYLASARQNVVILTRLVDEDGNPPDQPIRDTERGFELQYDAISSLEFLDKNNLLVASVDGSINKYSIDSERTFSFHISNNNHWPITFNVSDPDNSYVITNAGHKYKLERHLLHGSHIYAIQIDNISNTPIDKICVNFWDSGEINLQVMIKEDTQEITNITKSPEVIDTESIETKILDSSDCKNSTQDNQPDQQIRRSLELTESLNDNNLNNTIDYIMTDEIDSYRAFSINPKTFGYKHQPGTIEAGFNAFDYDCNLKQNTCIWAMSVAQKIPKKDGLKHELILAEFDLPMPLDLQE